MQNYFTSRWGLEPSHKAMEIAQLASQGALSHYVHKLLKSVPDIQANARKAQNFYGLMLEAGSAIGSYDGISPHMAFVISRIVNITNADSVRIDDAGDGTMAAFADSFPLGKLEVVEENETRRNVFSTIHPSLAPNMVAEPSSTQSDIYITSNPKASSISELLKGVVNGGRLIIAGNSEWVIDARESLKQARGQGTLQEYGKVLAEDDTIPRDRKLKRWEMFKEWRNLDAQTQGAIDFSGDGERPLYTHHKGGAIIVIDKVPQYGTSFIEAPFNLDLAGERAGVLASADKLRETRKTPSSLMREHSERTAAKKKRISEARARSKRVVAQKVRDGVRILPSLSSLKHRVLALGHKAQTTGIIPKDTACWESNRPCGVSRVIQRPEHGDNTDTLSKRRGCSSIRFRENPCSKR